MHPRRLPPVYLTAAMFDKIESENCQSHVMARKYRGMRG